MVNKKRNVRRKLAKKVDYGFDIGSWIFLLGVLIVLVFSIFKFSSNVMRIIMILLVLLGVVIGLLNIRRGEVITFLLSSIVFVMLLGPFIGVIELFFFGQNPTSMANYILTTFYRLSVVLVSSSAITVAFKEYILISFDEKDVIEENKED